MTKSGTYTKALSFATEKHRGQFRKGGKEYITHPVEVADMLRDRGYGEKYIITALFHDLLEDTDATEDEIRGIAGEEVLEAVKLLTKTEGYVMAEYVENIKNNPISFAVKAYDRLHNLISATESTAEFRKRYILETKKYYMDFCPEIRDAVRMLEKFDE